MNKKLAVILAAALGLVLCTVALIKSSPGLAQGQCYLTTNEDKAYLVEVLKLEDFDVEILVVELNTGSYMTGTSDKEQLYSALMQDGATLVNCKTLKAL